MFTVQPGWYPDPQQPGVVRAWDGHSWGAAAVPPPPAPPAPAGSGGGRLVLGLVLGLGALVVLGVLAAIAVPAFLSQRAEAAGGTEVAPDSLSLEVASGGCEPYTTDAGILSAQCTFSFLVANTSGTAVSAEASDFRLVLDDGQYYDNEGTDGCRAAGSGTCAGDLDFYVLADDARDLDEVQLTVGGRVLTAAAR